MAKKTKKKVKKTIKKPKKKARVLKSKKPKPKKIARKKMKRKIIRKKPRKIIRKRRIRKVKKAKPRKKIVKKVKKRIKKIRAKKPRKKKPAKPRVYIGKGALEQLFESQPKVKLLKFFFRNSKDIFQLKDIFKRLRSNVTILRRELSKLEDIGLIKQKRAWLTFPKKRGGLRKEKKTVYYLNLAFDFINELRNLILKSTVASKDDLANSVRKLGNIKLFLLAGVFTGDESSRADLLIVGDKINHRRLNNFLKDLEAEVGKELNCAVMTTKEFNYRYDMYDRFVRDLLTGKSEILINKVVLW
ncbi:MAG: hypothetical protein ACOZAL_01595 [Patescibacteria group bacterium]